MDNISVRQNQCLCMEVSFTYTSYTVYGRLTAGSPL